MLRRSMMIFPEDSVAMVLEDAQKGDVIETPRGRVELLEDVEFAHKVAVGYMLADAPVGTWIHNHNMGCDRGKV